MTPLLLTLCVLHAFAIALLVALVMLAASRFADVDARIALLVDEVADALDALPNTEPVELEAVVDERQELLADRLRERYVVTLSSGETFDGLLVDVDERTVVMQDTSALYADGRKVPVDGDVILQRATVAYLQRP